MKSEPIRFTGGEGNVLRGDTRGTAGGRASVLFMHGGGQTRHSWDAAAERVAERKRAVTLDARGHGKSDWVISGDYRFTALAADLATVCHELLEADGHSPILVGASMGGLSAMLAGAQEPDLFSALVLVDITPRMEQSGVDRILGFMCERSSSGFASVEEAADAIAAYLPGRERPASLVGLAKNLRQRDDGRHYWHWDPRFVSGPLAVEGQVEGHAELLEDGLRRLRCPVLLVRGSRSDLVSEEAVTEFKRAVPDAGYVDISGAGHMVVGDRNDAFSAAILNFLDRL